MSRVRSHGTPGASAHGGPRSALGLCVDCVASREPVGPLPAQLLASAGARVRAGSGRSPGGPRFWLGALYRYDGPVARAVVAAKNHGRRDLCRRLGPPLADLATAVELAVVQRVAGAGPRSQPPTDLGPEMVTWIPASRAGRRARGYDQGQLLAKSTGAALGVPVARLLRRRNGLGQTGRDRERRLLGPDLRVVGPVPRRVLVVDDVVTTGASAVAALEALRRAAPNTGRFTATMVAVAWAASRDEVAAARAIAAAGTFAPCDGCSPMFADVKW